ncbi:MAG: ThiF family adenylyltransferase, partial [Firmicutes bacterium]|nr:ThiF family adenylyltransferase [Bacillota bacterium]
MEGRDERTRRLIGDAGVATLAKSRVLVFGAGGVGGYVLEALVRTGVGTVGVCDFDTVSPSNMNRQLLALEPTVGRRKAELFAERAREIDPAVRVVCFTEKVSPENLALFGLGPAEDGGRDADGTAYEWDYVVDA